MKKLLLLFVAACASLACAAQDMLVQNVHIIDVESGQILRDQSILVQEGKITAVFPKASPPRNIPTNITKTDAKGAFAHPGLAEMHSHIPPASAEGDFSYTQDILWLYIANGILNVRGMMGHPSHLELKEKVASGEIISPRLFAAGPSLNGGSVQSPEHGAQMVREQKAGGFDHLKLHPGLDIPRFLAIANTAKEEGIIFGGHVSLDVGLANSLQHGDKSVEHMDGYIEALVADKSRLDPQVAGAFSMMALPYADMSKIPELVQMTLDSKAWIAPTLTLFERFFGYIPADQFRLEPDMKYLPGVQIQQWVNQKKLLENQGMLREEIVKPYLEFRQKMLLALHTAGVPILMSSDSPQVFNVPGFSIHNEIKSMNEAGMEPVEILKSGSANIARYFGQDGQYGMIKSGAAADFVLVSGNPLEDLSRLKNIEGLMLRGQWISKEKIQTELKRIEEKNVRR